MHHVHSANRSCASGLRSGFTVIELLTVIGILAVLAAILLPAVQGSRETARRVECGDHLRQIMIACQGHQSVHQTFPTSYPAHVTSTDPEVFGPSVSAFVHLLPYIEQNELYNRFDFSDVMAVTPDWYLPSSDVNRELMEYQVALYDCPSEPAERGISYRTCMGPGPGFTSFESNAPFVTLARFSAGAFTDGLTQTALFSERPIGDDDPVQYDPWRDVFLVQNGRNDPWQTAEFWRERCARRPVPSIGSYWHGGINWLRGGLQHTGYNHLFPPNSTIADCASGGVADGGPGSYAARSYHRGGVNVAFADGHVAFIGDSIDLAIWQAVSTRNGNEPIGDF